MKKFKVLVLTDHSGHSDQNSIYSLLREMLCHKQCESIDVISRGNSVNEAFFINREDQYIVGSRIKSNFSYSDEGTSFVKETQVIKLDSYNLVFMRLPRPIEDDWLLWIKKRMSQAIFINDPAGIIQTSNKKYLLNFPVYCPHMVFCNSADDVKAFASNFPIVLKPLKEYGGKGIVKIDGDMVDMGNKSIALSTYLLSINEDLTTDGYLAMKFLKNVSNGDKRILVVGGEIMGSSLRLPPDGSWLCNISQGGKSVKCDVTDNEKELIKAISPKLQSEGILIFGADTIEDDNGKRILSEVNTLSIGGFPQAQEQSGKPIIKLTVDKIFTYANEYK